MKASVNHLHMIMAVLITVGILLFLSGCSKPEDIKTGNENNIKTDKDSAVKDKRLDDDTYVVPIDLYSKAKAGDIITFGSYEQDNNADNGNEPIEWVVLSNDGNELFLVSKYVLDSKPYNEERAEITWENCTLRKWLNNDFYKSAFNKSEQNIIKSITIKNKDNPEYGTEGGNDTNDKLFLLSISDIINADFGFSTVNIAYDVNRRCAPTAYAVSQGARAYIGLSGEFQTETGEGACWWWLRSPGSTAVSATEVEDVGYVGYSGLGVFSEGGVRPAVIIDLK